MLTFRTPSELNQQMELFLNNANNVQKGGLGPVMEFMLKPHAPQTLLTCPGNHPARHEGPTGWQTTKWSFPL